MKPGHIGLAAIGSCSRCGGMTSSCSMIICKQCAESLGVCPYDELLNRWGTASEGDPEKIAACWLALIKRGYSNEREAARKALATFPFPGLAEAVAELESAPNDRRSPAPATFIVGFHAGIPPGIKEGGSFFNGQITGVNHSLRYVTAFTEDATRFEVAAMADPSVAFMEIETPGGPA